MLPRIARDQQTIPSNLNTLTAATKKK